MVSSEPDAKRIRLWNSGQTWPLFDLGPDCVAQYGFPYLMVHRGDLQSVLVAALRKLRPDAIRMGCRIVDLAQDAKGVTAIFGDGSRVSGTVLVAGGRRAQRDTQRHLRNGEGIVLRLLGMAGRDSLGEAARAAPDFLGRQLGGPRPGTSSPIRSDEAS